MQTPNQNWVKKSVWSDVQNAKFLHIVSGSGVLYDDDITKALRYIRCLRCHLTERLNQMRHIHFKYPLQKWKGVYSIFEESKVTIPRKDELMDAVN